MKKLLSTVICLLILCVTVFAGCKSASEAFKNFIDELQENNTIIITETTSKSEDKTDNSDNKTEKTEKKKEKSEDTKTKEDIPEPTQEQNEFACYDFKKINATQRKYYKIISNAIQELNRDKFKIASYENDADIIKNIQLAFTSVIADHPEYFWLKSTLTTYKRSDNGDVFVQLSYTEENDNTIKEMIKQLNTVLEKISDASDGLDYFEKEVYFHDYLCKTVSYDKNCDYCNTCYGALVNKKGLCEAYSKAMQLLCNNADINCVTVRGSDKDGISHMWNKVELSGEWYALDVTWDDPINGNKTYYTYFNLTDAEFAKTHNTDINYTKDTLPDKMDNLEYNYCLPDATGKYYTANRIENFE